jgi:hypothetical protein
MNKIKKRMNITFPEYKDTENESEESLTESMKAYVGYLNNVVHDPVIASSDAFLQFCETSKLTITKSNAKRLKEGILVKRSGGRHKHEKRTFLTYCGKCCRVWAK